MVATQRREEGVRVLRVTLSQAILVMSGRCRMMYQRFGPKPEGTIFSKRSKPQGTYSSPHDTVASMAEQLEMNIQGDIERAEKVSGVECRQKGPEQAATADGAAILVVREISPVPPPRR